MATRIDDLPGQENRIIYVERRPGAASHASYEIDLGAWPMGETDATRSTYDENPFADTRSFAGIPNGAPIASRLFGQPPAVPDWLPPAPALAQFNEGRQGARGSPSAFESDGVAYAQPPPPTAGGDVARALETSEGGGPGALQEEAYRLDRTLYKIEVVEFEDGRNSTRRYLDFLKAEGMYDKRMGDEEILALLEEASESGGDPFAVSAVSKVVNEESTKPEGPAEDRLLALADQLLQKQYPGAGGATPEEILEILGIASDAYDDEIARAERELYGPSGRSRSAIPLSSDRTPPTPEEASRLHSRLDKALAGLARIDELALEPYTIMFRWGRIPYTGVASRARASALYNVYSDRGMARKTLLDILNAERNRAMRIASAAHGLHTSGIKHFYLSFHLRRLIARVYNDLGDMRRARQWDFRALQAAVRALQAGSIEVEPFPAISPNISVQDVTAQIAEFRVLDSRRIASQGISEAPTGIYLSRKARPTSQQAIFHDVAHLERVFKLWEELERTRLNAERIIGTAEARGVEPDGDDIRSLFELEKEAGTIAQKALPHGEYGERVSDRAWNWISKTFKPRMADIAPKAYLRHYLSCAGLPEYIAAEMFGVSIGGHSAVKKFVDGENPTTLAEWRDIYDVIDREFPYRPSDRTVNRRTRSLLLRTLYGTISRAHSDDPASIVPLYQGRLAYALGDPVAAAILTGHYVLDLKDEELQGLTPGNQVNAEEVLAQKRGKLLDVKTIEVLFRPQSSEIAPDDEVPEIILLDTLRTDDKDAEVIARAIIAAANAFKERALSYIASVARGEADKNREISHHLGHERYGLQMARDDLARALKLFEQAYTKSPLKEAIVGNILVEFHRKLLDPRKAAGEVDRSYPWSPDEEHPFDDPLWNYEPTDEGGEEDEGNCNGGTPTNGSPVAGGPGGETSPPTGPSGGFESTTAFAVYGGDPAATGAMLTYALPIPPAAALSFTGMQLAL